MNEEAHALLTERFGGDALIALATCVDGVPHVRTVNAHYMDGALYCVTDLRSAKMKQMEKNLVVAVCGEWFTGHGRAACLGHVLDERNREIMAILRRAFAAWYSNGHVCEEDTNTVLLRIALEDGVLLSHGKRIEI